MTTAQDNPQVAAILSSVQHSYAELTRLLNGPLAALESSKLYRQPAENEWTIMQNLAHTVEFMPYWANEVALLVAEPCSMRDACAASATTSKTRSPTFSPCSPTATPNWNKR
jgi:uncharacterized damage-inducible protein DinB